MSTLSGAYQLDFDYRRFRLSNAFTSPSGSINLTVYGITDDATPGWTTSGGTSFNTSSAPNSSGDDIPVLNGATISELTFFSSGVLQNQWFSESRSFDLSSYDTVVIRLGSRIRLRARAGTNFDNLALTAVPEPSSCLLALRVAPVLARRKRRSSPLSSNVA